MTTLDTKITAIQDTYTMPGRYSVNDEDGNLIGFRKRADAISYAARMARHTTCATIWTKPFWAVAVVRYNDTDGTTGLYTFDRYGRESYGEEIHV